MSSDTTSSHINMGRWIVVSLPKHLITVMENGETVKEVTSFATGRAGHLTPLVQDAPIDPARRFKEHTSSLYNNKSGHPAEMPYAMFFSGGCAFHAGDPDTESHGCIHLKMQDAEWLFNWVGHSDVHVRVEGPRSDQPTISLA